MKEMARKEVRVLGLASGSPRRRELLSVTGWQTKLIPVEVDEQPLPAEAAEDVARRLAMTKARQASAASGPSVITLGADTVVVDGERQLGKPMDVLEASQMLERLAGRTHRVVTAVVLADKEAGTEAVEICTTVVPMRGYTAKEIAAYVASGAPFDKAGGYGIQDDGFQPVDLKGLHGCYANVMGLPLCHLVRAMRRLGHAAPADVPKGCMQHTGYDCPVHASILRGEA